MVVFSLPLVTANPSLGMRNSWCPPLASSLCTMDQVSLVEGGTLSIPFSSNSDLPGCLFIL